MEVWINLTSLYIFSIFFCIFYMVTVFNQAFVQGQIDKSNPENFVCTF